jgi:hypothetical protein
MARETDWHVFDKACEITAMAVRGTAAGVEPAQVADVFREVYRSLRETADQMEPGQQAGF